MESRIDNIYELKDGKINLLGQETTEGARISKTAMQEKYNVKITRLSYGIPMGGDIEYLDPIMISKAWDDRKVIS